MTGGPGRALRAGALCLLLADLLAGCSGSGDRAGAGTSFVAGDGVVTRVQAARRGQAVQVSGRSLAGTPVSLAGWRGSPVVVNVWGSWCTPCRKEAADLQAASVELAGDGVRFVGIDIRDNDDAARAFQQQYKITYPSLSTADGSLLLAFRGAVPPAAIPTTLVLDAQGRIAARLSGAVTRTTLVELVRDVAAGR